MREKLLQIEFVPTFVVSDFYMYKYAHKWEFILLDLIFEESVLNTPSSDQDSS